MFQFKFKGRKMPIPAPGSEAGGIPRSRRRVSLFVLIEPQLIGRGPPPWEGSLLSSVRCCRCCSRPGTPRDSPGTVLDHARAPVAQSGGRVKLPITGMLACPCQVTWQILSDF